MRFQASRAVFVLVTIGACFSVAAAQQRQIGGVGLTLFEHVDFGGRAATLRDDTPDFEAIGMNDHVSSLRVAPGERWEVCEHANYRGRCVVVSGDKPDLRPMGFNDIISSARRVRSGGGSGGGSRPPVQPPGSSGLELFSRTGFGGNRRAFTGPVPDLRRAGFNDSAQSLRLGQGQVWQVCADVNFVNCMVVNSDYQDLRGLGMAGRIRSVRPWLLGTSGRASIVLFDDRGYRGKSFRVDGARPDLSGFANRAVSAQVISGSWQLCDRPGFGGRCVVVSGSVPDLSSIGLRNRVASVRPAQASR